MIPNSALPSGCSLPKGKVQHHRVSFLKTTLQHHLANTVLLSQVNQPMDAKISGQSLRRKRTLAESWSTSPKIFTNYKGKNTKCMQWGTGRHYLTRVSKIRVTRNKIWQHRARCSEKNTQSLLWWPCRNCITSVYAWENIWQTPTEGHPSRTFHQNQGHRRTLTDWRATETRKQMLPRILSWTPKGRREVSGKAGNSPLRSLGTSSTGSGQQETWAKDTKEHSIFSCISAALQLMAK